ncbi:NAD(P)/FAD-dependent oxidoreductase [Pseudoroseicyclus tamaricis]|uniref:FAD-dependent oxidoreductase n=1 Tax=Pseudoroseicyclus tamaricis TaxID=2705421 RepID=A0A6B2JXG2_9RHOB|nr:FAD-dependent oxidoreductase [Pseudoroseicyclus tamaricis]NDV00042.1 FAD-dependent oxidoreductase [Pseudoroseicyclus tamaricis]
MNDMTALGPTAYDPSYDPIMDPGPGRGRDYAPTYWIDTAGPAPEDDGPVQGEVTCDVAVVGSGYTGLNCAIALARDYGMDVAVLEANRTAWGCSSRNGGQAQISAGRLKRSGWIREYGLEMAQGLHREMKEAFAYFERVIEEGGIDCEAQRGGHYYIAHKPQAVPALQAEAECYREQFGYPAEFLPREEVFARAVHDQEAAGALWEPDGTAIHAGKLAFGYHREARRLGVRIHTGSPVAGWVREGSGYRLTTPQGTIRAKAIAIATAAYTAGAMSPVTRARLLPIISNSVVTRPLTAAELAACGFATRAPITDTRTLRHYYRLLPGDRLQIGSRGAITGRDAPQERHVASLRAGLERKFPALAGIEFDYSWWGWVDVSHDQMPRITRPRAGEAVFYAMGYGGNGVMYSAQAGRRMAQLVAGESLPDLPIFKGELKHHGPLTPFRRIGQRFLYRWYHLRDERL